MGASPLHDPDYLVFADLLRTARKEVGLTQIELADRLRVEQSTISKIERRERRVDVAELRRICRALGVSFVDFASRFDAALGARKRSRRRG